MSGRAASATQCAKRRATSATATRSARRAGGSPSSQVKRFVQLPLTAVSALPLFTISCAGLAAVLGAVVIVFAPLRKDTVLAAALAFAAGVMLYVSVSTYRIALQFAQGDSRFSHHCNTARDALCDCVRSLWTSTLARRWGTLRTRVTTPRRPSHTPRCRSSQVSRDANRRHFPALKRIEGGPVANSLFHIELQDWQLAAAVTFGAHGSSTRAISIRPSPPVAHLSQRGCTQHECAAPIPRVPAESRAGFPISWVLDIVCDRWLMSEGRRAVQGAGPHKHICEVCDQELVLPRHREGAVVSLACVHTPHYQNNTAAGY